jgi:hypothetical protein
MENYCKLDYHVVHSFLMFSEDSIWYMEVMFMSCVCLNFFEVFSCCSQQMTVLNERKDFLARGSILNLVIFR